MEASSGSSTGHSGSPPLGGDAGCREKGGQSIPCIQQCLPTTGFFFPCPKALLEPGSLPLPKPPAQQVPGHGSAFLGVPQRSATQPSAASPLPTGPRGWLVGVGTWCPTQAQADLSLALGST